MPSRTVYLPLITYPEAAPDESVAAAVGVGTSLGDSLHVTTFAVDVPPTTTPFGGLMLDVAGMIRAAEDRSAQECTRLAGFVQQKAAGKPVKVTSNRQIMGGAADAASTEARYFDVSVLPWAADTVTTRDLAQAIVFASGRPAVLVPPSAKPGPVSHLAVAWDESRVAARALGDALPLLAPGGKVTVITVGGEKALPGEGLAQTLVAALELRGVQAQALDVALAGRNVAETLQDAAVEAGAQMLAMGGFGHSRFRDFVLGSATKGVLSDLRLPVLLAH